MEAAIKQGCGLANEDGAAAPGMGGACYHVRGGAKQTGAQLWQQGLHLVLVLGVWLMRAGPQHSWNGAYYYKWGMAKQIGVGFYAIQGACCCHHRGRAELQRLQYFK